VCDNIYGTGCFAYAQGACECYTLTPEWLSYSKSMESCITVIFK